MFMTETTGIALGESRLDESSEVFRYILLRSTYSFTSGEIAHYQTEAFLHVSLKFGLHDSADYVSRRFISNTVIHSSGGVHSVLPPAVTLTEDKLKGSVKCSSYEFRVVESSSDPNVVFAEVWDGYTQIARAKIPGMREVQFHGLFGSPQFIAGTKVAFIAEPSDTKFPRGYFEKKSDECAPVKEKFRMRTDYGETAIKTRTPRLVIFDGEAQLFNTVEIPCCLRGRIDAAFPTPIPGCEDSLLITGYMQPLSLFTPGLSRCLNRPSAIYRIDGYLEDAPRVSCLTEGIYLALAPVVSPDGSKFVFAGHQDKFSPHCTELDLFVINLKGENIKPNRLDAITRIRCDESLIPTYNGLCLTSQTESNLIKFLPDNRTVVVPSFSSGKGGIFLIDVESQTVVTSVFPTGQHALSSVILLTVSGNDILFVHQGYTTLRSVYLARIDPSDHTRVEYIKIFTSPELPRPLFDGFLDASISVIKTENCPAWLLRSGKKRSIPSPLIAYLHGGPNMMSVTSLSVEMAVFLAQGYDVVIPNYRGSLSFGKEFLHSLVGKAGILDVSDCHACVEKARGILNPSCIIAYGGSHGGFLTAWLLGNPETRSVYNAGVLWNPAVDLVSSNLTSDIPEWALAAALTDSEIQGENVFAPSDNFLRKASAQSPISVVGNVQVPSLVLLGASDKRVVPCAGLRWAQAIEARGGEVDVLWYPDQGHAIPAPESYENAIISINQWIQKQVRTGTRS